MLMRILTGTTTEKDIVYVVVCGIVLFVSGIAVGLAF